MKRMFTCSVGCQHAIEIERWESDDGTEWEDAVNGPIDLNVWYQPESLGERLRNAWRILRGRQVVTEGICLSLPQARQMGAFLLNISSAQCPADVRTITVSSATTTATTNVTYRKPESK
jgi:hypothetical protein